MFALLDSGKGAFSAGLVKDFQSMSLPHKLMELSFILAPIALAIGAHLAPEKKYQANFFWLAAAYVAISVLSKLTDYARGFLALRRGVQPEWPATEFDSRTAAWDRILGNGLLVAVPLVALVYVYFVPSSRQWATAAFVFALWLAPLSAYPRTRLLAMRSKGPEGDLVSRTPAIQ